MNRRIVAVALAAALAAGLATIAQAQEAILIRNGTIATASACKTRLLFTEEATSSLDVTFQPQIIDILLTLQR